MKSKDLNRNDIKKKKTLIIVTVIALILIIGACGANKSESSSDSSQSSITSSSEFEETTIATETVVNTTKITNVSDLENRTEKFVEDVKTAIEDAVGANEYITDVSLSDNILTISVDLSKADTSIISVEDLAISRAQSITDDFLELQQYDDLWKEIIVDFGDVGYVKRTPNDITKTILGSQTLRYFEIDELNNSNNANMN